MNHTQLNAKDLLHCKTKSTKPAQPHVLAALLVDIVFWRNIPLSAFSLELCTHGRQLEVEPAELGLSKVVDWFGAAGEDSEEEHGASSATFDSTDIHGNDAVRYEF